jgi:ABC-type uncharacterized transport system permease subunit
MITILTFTCITNYVLAAYACRFRMRGYASRQFIFLFSFIAIVLHGFLLYKAIETGAGQNLDLGNVLSLVGWLVACLLMLTALRKPVEVLGIFIFPISALLVLNVWLFPGQVILNTKESPLQLIHILTSLLAVSMIGLSALQAVALFMQASRLRRHASGQLLSVFPALETLESLLFSTIWLGFGLLSISLITGLIYWFNEQDSHILLKVIFVIIAWCIFATLLLGRYLLKWRGTHAINWTLIGLGLLIIAYLGTHYLN